MAVPDLKPGGTHTDLLVSCYNAGIRLSGSDDGFLHVESPVGVLTDAVRTALRDHKPMLLAVLWRLDGMLTHRAPVPTAKSATDAPGGPGRCFSCGDVHEHPHAYGRCAWCSLAAEAFYRLRGGPWDDIQTVRRQQK